MSDFKIKIGAELDNDVSSSIQQQLNRIKNLKININAVQIGVENVTATANGIGKQLGKELGKSTQNAFKTSFDGDIFNANKIKSLQQVSTYMTQNSKATKQFGNALGDLKTKLANVSNPAELRLLRTEFMTLKSQVNELGLAGRSFGQEFGNVAGKFSSWIGVSTIVMSAIHGVQNAFSTIYQLDSGMIELKKVTEGTTQEYRNFYYASNDVAKALGTTNVEVINSSANWAQLGLDIDKAVEAAKNTSIFKTISPEMSLEQAQSSLVSTTKAYKIDVEDALDGVISKVNIVGNNLAATNSNIAEILRQSASAMSAANNSLDENIALGVAGQEIVQNDANVGAALKSVSMRIRALDEETNTYDKTLESVKESVKGLSGVSVFTDDSQNTYKSTYQYLSEISKIWDNISDKSQANLAEELFGKHRANVGLAIISNFESAEKAMDLMKDSAGSAMKEFEKAQDGIAFKLNALTQTGVGIFQNLIDSDAVKTTIDLFTNMLTVIDSVTGALGSLGTAGGLAFGILGSQGKGWVNYTVADSYALI